MSRVVTAWIWLDHRSEFQIGRTCMSCDKFLLVVMKPCPELCLIREIVLYFRMRIKLALDMDCGLNLISFQSWSIPAQDKSRDSIWDGDVTKNSAQIKSATSVLYLTSKIFCDVFVFYIKHFQQLEI